MAYPFLRKIGVFINARIRRLHSPSPRFSYSSGSELLVAQWKVVDDALEDRAWLVGAGCTAVDIYLHMVSTWDRDPRGFAARCPNVVRVATAVARRPAVVRALARHAMLVA